MGILKNMLYRAYHLCDPGPEREEEIKTLNFAFINQNYPPKEVLKTIQSYEESDGNKGENKRAEERTESIVVPYIKGVSEKLRKDLGKEDINVVFKRGKTLHSMIFNGKFKKNDGRKKDLIYKIPCRDCSLCYIGETAQWYDERERNSIKDAFETMTKIMHSSDISEQLDMILHGIKWSLLHLKGEHNAGK